MWPEHFEPPDGLCCFVWEVHWRQLLYPSVLHIRMKKGIWIPSVWCLPMENIPVSETGLSAGLSLDLSFMVSLPLQSSELLYRAKPPHGNLVPQGLVFYFRFGTKSLFLVWSRNQRDLTCTHLDNDQAAADKTHAWSRVMSNDVEQFSAWGKYKRCEAVITRRGLPGHGDLLSWMSWD